MTAQSIAGAAPRQPAPPNSALHAAILPLLPRLRAQARALARNRADADDLVQDAVLRALAAPAGPAPITAHAGWMYRILRNCFLSELRRRRRAAEFAALWADTTEPAGSPFEQRAALDDLHVALASLAEPQRQALYLVVLEGLSYEAAARATGAATGTTAARVFRARRALQQRLQLPEKV
ncbi:MAG TPA: RNA polymerase sigma factor [Crenalkalicoccus sp.]|nr:RNA polymerase sigma factor [Crenalkalicoccus sp.]